MDKDWVCLLFLVHYTALTASQYSCTNDSISLVGLRTNAAAAGYLEICFNGTMWAVYDESWGAEEAAIACQLLGFSPHGARACGGSCLGNSSLEHGLTNFTSCTDELVDCGTISTKSQFDNNAGVICCQNCTSLVKSTNNKLEESSIKVAISIAGATVVLFLTLVGVVIGWVYSCHRNKLNTRKRTKERTTIKLAEQTLNPDIRLPSRSFSLSEGPLSNPDYGHISEDDGPLKNPTYTPTSAHGLYFDDDNLSYDLTRNHTHSCEDSAEYEVINEPMTMYEIPISSVSKDHELS